MKFIKLTGKIGGKVWINFEFVESFSSSGDFTQIWITTDLEAPMEVREMPDQIANQLGK